MRQAMDSYGWTEKQRIDGRSCSMSWIDQVAWKTTFVLDREFDEWVYIQEVEQTYTSKQEATAHLFRKEKKVTGER